MAKKAKAVEPIANPWAFFDTVKTTDPFLDAGKERPTYGFADSGSYALNGILCGDIYGGFPMNKIVQTAGLEGSGKSLLGKYNFCPPLFAQGYFIFYIDTENETTREDLINLCGFPPQQFKVIHFHTVEQTHQGISTILKQLEDYMEKNKTLVNPNKMAIVLDSQGMLSTTKNINDVLKGEDKTDLTKAKKLANMYRDITFRLGELGVPMYVTNHIYIDPNAATTHSDPKKVAGGNQSKYSASIILTVYKMQEKINKNGKDAKDGKEVTGLFINVNAAKNRLVHDGFGTKLYLSYKHGLNKYFGLHTWAIEAGLLKKYSKSEFGDIEPPRKDGRVFSGNAWVVCDPKKPRAEWLACPEGSVHCEKYIGSIKDEINEFIHAKYKNQRIGMFGDDESESGSESELEGVSLAELDEADAAETQRQLNEAVSKAEALGLDAEGDMSEVG